MSSQAVAPAVTDAEKIVHANLLADWFEAMCNTTPIKIEPNTSDLLVGPVHMNWEGAGEVVTRPYDVDGYHCPMGAKQLLTMGFVGIAETAAANADTLAGLPKQYLLAVARCYRAACRYAQSWANAASDAADAAAGDERVRLTRIANACRSLVTGRPDSFLAAAQLLWFGLAMRNAGVTSPPGRLDQYLNTYYVADLAADEITPAEAQRIVDELFTKMDTIAHGDGLMNLVLGGVDADGNDVGNEMSILMMDAACRLKIASPQMNVRIHAGTSEAFRQKATELQLAPTGGCSILNDEAIIPAMVADGIPLDLARNYCCDGCNELLFDGEILIDFTAAPALKCLERTLLNGRQCPLPEGVAPKARYHYASHDESDVRDTDKNILETGDFAQMTSFEQVFEAYIAQYEHRIHEGLVWFCRNASERARDRLTNPFLAGTFPQCLATGLDPMTDGNRWYMFMVFAGSIPTVADGLAAIKKVIFEDRACTAAEMLAALEADWDGYEALRRQCLTAPKFGNDDPYVDDIVVEIINRFDRIVREYPHGLNHPIYPALFCHQFNLISMAVSATPDGRRRGDDIAEHFSPVPGRALHGPTAVINSQAKAPLNRMVGTAVTHISLSRSALGTPEQAAAAVNTLVDAAIRMGLFVINLPIYDVEKMIEAQKHPEQYADLMVRVWGFSDRFTTLDKRLQDHLIARATNG